MAEEVQNVDQKSSYRSIFKATSLFGGVQVYQILISVIKSKFIAVLLGTTGIGIQGLYQSALQLIQSLTSMGLSTSAVRNVSEANGSGNVPRIYRVVTVLRKLVWFTGILGLLAVVALSPVLSETAFGNSDYVIPFIILSITLLLDQLAAGQRVVLQGMRKLKDLAKASAIGSTIGLIVSVPLYYLLDINGIVPTLILNSVASLSITWFFARKIHIEEPVISTKQVIHEGAGMMKMGLAMSLTNILTYGCAYAVRGYIRNLDGTEAVGLYTAGFAIISTYVGMVFTAMSTDYYPRLAAVNNDNIKCSEVVNQQGEIATLILCPLLIICMVFMPFVVRILYSEAFLPASNFIVMACIGMFFKLGSWLVAYQFIAKGESTLFVVNEFSANVYMLALNIIGYKTWGLLGIGISFTIGYLFYFLQVLLISHRKYGYKMKDAFAKLYFTQLVFVLITYFFIQFENSFIKYLLGSSLILISCFYSLKGLDKRLGVISLLKHIKNG